MFKSAVSCFPDEEEVATVVPTETLLIEGQDGSGKLKKMVVMLLLHQSSSTHFLFINKENCNLYV